MTWREGASKPPTSAIFTALETAVFTYPRQASLQFKRGFVARVIQKAMESVNEVKFEELEGLQRQAGAECIKPLIQLIHGGNPEAYLQGMAICKGEYGCAACSQQFLTDSRKASDLAEIEVSVCTD